MIFQQIRSATVKISYGGKTFLIDPWLTPRYMSGCLAMIPMICAANRGGDTRKKYVIDHCATWKAVNTKHKWTMCPLSPLPMSVKLINHNVDVYLCTHVHLDHIGLSPLGKGCEGMDRDIPVYAINRQDADFLEYSGMKDGRVLEERVCFGETELIKVKAIHGTKKPCCDACGYIFRAPGEKTLYVAGDTVWCEEVAETIRTYRPEIIVTNNCAAMLVDNGRLIMDDEDLAKVCAAAPEAVIIASHMDAVPHATLTRKTLREKLRSNSLRRTAMSVFLKTASAISSDTYILHDNARRKSGGHLSFLFYIRCSEVRCRRSVRPRCRGQVPSLPAPYPAARPPGQSCSGSTRSPGT